MKLDKTQLLELQDYINMLDEQVGLDADTMLDITRAIDKELDRVREEESLITHFDQMGSFNIED